MTKPKDWQKDFDKKWGSGLYPNIDDFGGLNIGNVNQNRWIISFITDLLKEAVEAERNSWLNQKANQHDERIRADERARIESLIPEKKSLLFPASLDTPNLTNIAKAEGFNEAISIMQEAVKGK